MLKDLLLKSLNLIGQSFIIASLRNLFILETFASHFLVWPCTKSEHSPLPCLESQVSSRTTEEPSQRATIWAALPRAVGWPRGQAAMEHGAECDAGFGISCQVSHPAAAGAEDFERCCRQQRGSGVFVSVQQHHTMNISLKSVVNRNKFYKSMFSPQTYL